MFYPKIDLEDIKFEEIINRRLRFRVQGLAMHSRLVEDEKDLIRLRSKYNFLSEIYNIYWTPPNYIVPPHVDLYRKSALNIPISYTEDSHTIFYKAVGETNTTVLTDKNYSQITSNLTEVFRFTLTEPTIINTTIPHSVIGGPKLPRIILSWSIVDTFENIKEKLG